MKKHLLFLLMAVCAAPLLLEAQGGMWVFLKGDTLGDVNGEDTAVFGTMGIPAAANMPGGLYEVPNWIDKQGRFWIFGGRTDGFTELNNFWMYNPGTNNWTWMGGSGNVGDVNGVMGIQGVPSPANYPGARAWGTDSWTDSSGDLWMFGGQGWDGIGGRGMLNDLWRYHIATNEWTWMSGTDTANALGVYGNYRQSSVNNHPCSRYENTATWKDSSNGLWLFGGGEYPSYTGSNVMWRYDISTNGWAWIKGPMGTGPGNYGVLGVEDPNNVPPARNAYCAWQDVSGNFYLFGGRYIGLGGYNDVWEFNTHTDNWTWVAGDSGINKPAYYGQLCIDNESLGPEARIENRGPKLNGASNIFISCGGSSGGYHDANAVWAFNSQTREWYWINGDSTCINNGFGHIGTPGVPSPLNYPGCTAGDPLWMDADGNFWLFGGSSHTELESNFIWKYIPDKNCIGPIITGINYNLSDNEICKGDSAFLNLLNLASAGIYPLNGVSFSDSAHIYLSPDSTTRYIVTGSSGLRSPDTAVITIYVYPVIAPTIVASNGETCITDSTLLCAPAGYTNYHWTTGQHTPCIAPLAMGNYAVTTTDANGCTAVSNAISIHAADSTHNYITALDSLFCPGDSARIVITGLSNASITPAVNLVAVDSVDYYGYIINNQTTVYTLIGQGLCNPVRQNFTVGPINRGFGITTDKTSLCNGDSALICAPPNFSTYQWNTGDTTSCIYAHDSGQYVVIVSQTGNCTVTSNTINITDNPPADDSITVHGDTLMAFGDVSYQWLYNNSPISGATSNTYIASVNGNYSLQVTNSAGCSAEASKQVVLTGIAEEQIENSILVFPNPTTNGWQLDVNPALLGSTVEVFDVTGRLVFKNILENQQSFVSFTAARGVYQLRINLQGYSFVRKLIKL